MRPTRATTLLAVSVVGGLLGFGFVPLAEAMNGTAPRVEWTSTFGLAVVAVAVLSLAVSTYRTVHREQRPMPARRAMNFLMFAKACALAGAFITGGYIGFAVHFVDNMEADLPRERVVRSIVAAAISAVVVIGGLLLERACRVPKGDDS